MSEEIKINADTVLKSDNGTIKMSTNDDITIKRSVNHNEISILENEWDLIKKNLYKINTSKQFNLPLLVLGAIIPYVIDFIASLSQQKNPDYAPLTIALSVFVISILLKRVFRLFNDHSESNKIYIDNIKEIISQIDSSSKNI